MTRRARGKCRSFFALGQPSRRASVCQGSIRFNPVVSLLAAGVLWGFVLYAVLDDEAVTVFGEWQSWVTSTFTWLYIVSQALSPEH